MLRNLLEFATNVLLKLVSIVNCSNTRNIHSEGTDLSKCFKQIWCAEKYTCDTCVYQVFHPSTCNYDRRSQYSITSALRRPNTCVFWFQIHHCCFTKEKLLLEKTQGRFLIVLQLKTLPLPGGLHLLKNDDTILMGKTNKHPYLESPFGELTTQTLIHRGL